MSVGSNVTPHLTSNAAFGWIELELFEQERYREPGKKCARVNGWLKQTFREMKRKRSDAERSFMIPKHCGNYLFTFKS